MTEEALETDSEVVKRVKNEKRGRAVPDRGAEGREGFAARRRRTGAKRPEKAVRASLR